MKPEMSAVLVIVRDVIKEESLQVAGVQWDHVIEQLAATASYPALGDTILPGTPNRGSRAGYFHRVDCGRDFQPILGIMIENHKLGCGLVRKRLSQLLDDPTARQMASDIEVHATATVVADDEEAVEHIKGECWYGEEIHCGDGHTMITQECQPAPCGFKISRCLPHPAGHGDFGYFEAQHEKFAMDTRRTPRRILRDHLVNQLAYLLGNSPTTTDSSSHFAEHGPVQFEACPVPANHGFWQDEHECVLPLSPKAADYNPEQSVERTYLGPRMPAFEHGELLAQC